MQENTISRAYTKLQHAIDTFKIECDGKIAADFGSSTGGFTKCLLDYGCNKVYSVDTAYGELSWDLRNNPKVVVLERTNAIHVMLPEKMDIIVVDVGWTKQEIILPNVIKNLKPHGVILSLIKPHYEAEKSMLYKGKLKSEYIETVLKTVYTKIKNLELDIIDVVKSPILGKNAGNKEYIAFIKQK